MSKDPGAGRGDSAPGAGRRDSAPGTGRGDSAPGAAGPGPHVASYRVRFDECGAGGGIRPGTLLRYAQDVAWRHSEAVGFDRSWYRDRGLAWVVRAVDLAIIGTAHSGETIRLATRVTGARRIWARRQTEVLAADGRPIATIATDWVMIDARGTPVRIPDEIPRVFGRLPPYEPGRLTIGAAPADAAPDLVVVGPHLIDPMGHVNNAAWLDLVDDGCHGRSAAGDGTKGSSVPGRTGARFRLEYVAPAVAGDLLERRVWPLGDGFACRIDAPDGSDRIRAHVRPPVRATEIA